MSKRHRIVQVDAFSVRPFRGNPAAVCLLDEERPSDWMQKVAAEMNLSETAFVRATDDGFSLRWFTPASEVELCGHATLASAHVLWESGLVGEDEEISFDTLSGRLTARPGEGRWIELDFPARPAIQADPPDGLLTALGIEPSWTGRSKEDVLLLLPSVEAVESVQPDFQSLARIELRGCIITAIGDGRDYDFVSRFFAPAVGVPEDPVTGSAHCTLSPFWSQRIGRKELIGFQASARSGIVRTRLEGDRVLLGGQALTVLEGELVV